MTTMMTTRMVVRNGACCLGRSAASSAFTIAGARRPTSGPAAPPSPGAPPPRRDAPVVRAVATDAATDATTSAAKPFKRHERIAAIKVRAPSRARALGRPPLAPTRAPYPNPSRRVPPRPARPYPLRT